MLPLTSMREFRKFRITNGQLATAPRESSLLTCTHSKLEAVVIRRKWKCSSHGHRSTSLRPGNRN
jgi:hypothetical protein